MVEKLKEVRSHTRKTKSGKTVIVRAHKARYNAAEDEAKETSKKKGAGKEFESAKSKREFEFGEVPAHFAKMGVTQADWDEWMYPDSSHGKGDANKMEAAYYVALQNKYGKDWKRALNYYEVTARTAAAAEDNFVPSGRLRSDKKGERGNWGGVKPFRPRRKYSPQFAEWLLKEPDISAKTYKYMQQMQPAAKK